MVNKKSSDSQLKRGESRISRLFVPVNKKYWFKSLLFNKIDPEEEDWLLNYFKAHLLWYIFIGTLGGCLIYATEYQRTGEMPFIDALFTSFSAVCITGLLTRNAAYFTLPGQIITLILLWIGGLTLTSLPALVFKRRRAKFRMRKLRQYSGSSSNNSAETDKEYLAATIALITVPILVFGILFLSFIAAAIHLSIWYDTQEELRGVHPWWVSLFTVVSCFNNAGISLFEDNVVIFQRDVFMNFLLMFLIIIGNTGFPACLRITLSVVKKAFHGRIREGFEYLLTKHHFVTFHLFPPLQTRVYVFINLVLQILGLTSFLILDLKDNTDIAPGAGIGWRFLSGVFMSVSTRTAGFNTINLAAISYGTLFLYIVMMRVKPQMCCALDEYAYSFVPKMKEPSKAEIPSSVTIPRIAFEAEQRTIPRTVPLQDFRATESSKSKSSPSHNNAPPKISSSPPLNSSPSRSIDSPRKINYDDDGDDDNDNDNIHDFQEEEKEEKRINNDQKQVVFNDDDIDIESPARTHVASPLDAVHYEETEITEEEEEEKDDNDNDHDEIGDYHDAMDNSVNITIDDLYHDNENENNYNDHYDNNNMNNHSNNNNMNNNNNNNNNDNDDEMLSTTGTSSEIEGREIELHSIPLEPTLPLNEPRNRYLNHRRHNDNTFPSSQANVNLSRQPPPEYISLSNRNVAIKERDGHDPEPDFGGPVYVGEEDRFITLMDMFYQYFNKPLYRKILITIYTVYKKIAYHFRRLILKNNYWLLLITFLICVADGSKLRKYSAFTVFAIAFEVISAFGNVGLSLGFPEETTSFVTVFSGFSKFLIIATMVLGRHRGYAGAFKDQRLGDHNEMHRVHKYEQFMLGQLLQSSEIPTAVYPEKSYRSSSPAETPEQRSSHELKYDDNNGVMPKQQTDHDNNIDNNDNNSVAMDSIAGAATLPSPRVSLDSDN